MTIIDSGNNRYSQKILVATATRGTMRAEWVSGRYGMLIPTNWSKTDLTQMMNSYYPLRYVVADAQNLSVKECLSKGFEWLLFIEDDTIPSVDAFRIFTEYMDKGNIPVVSGLYFTKSVPPEPMVYRGRGNHYFRDWKLEDKVWCDGVPTGMLLIHASLLEAVWKDSPDYFVPQQNNVTRRVFESPSQTWFNEEKGMQEALIGTSDLNFCTKVIDGDYLTKAGFPEIAKKKYPFLIDTNIYCKHISPDGVQYPIEFPKEFLSPLGEKYKGKEIGD